MPRLPLKRSSLSRSAGLSALKRSGSEISQIIMGREGLSPSGILDKIIFGIIAAVFLVCPWFFTSLTAQGIGFDKLVLFYFLVLAGTVLWLGKSILAKKIEFKISFLDWPILALLGFAIVSTILSVGVKDSLVGAYGSGAKSLAALVAFILFYYLVINNVNRARVKFLFWSFVASSSLIIVYSLAQIFGVFLLPFAFTQNVGFNPIGSFSSLAIFLIASLPILIIAMAQLEKINPGIASLPKTALKTLLGMVILADLIALAALQGFASWLVALLSVLIILIFALAKIVEITPANLAIPISIFLILIVLLVGNFNFINVALPAEVSLSRGLSWDIAKESLKADPFFGSGPATFYYGFNQYRGDSFNNTNLWNVSFDSGFGVFLETLATLGIFGCLALVFAVIGGIYFLLRSLLKNENEDTASLELGLFSGAAVLAVFALLSAFNSSLIFYAVLFIVLSAAVGMAEREDKKEFNFSFRSSSGNALAISAIFLALSAGAVIIFTLGAKMYLADMSLKRAISLSDNKEIVAELEKAISLASYEDNYYSILANTLFRIANEAAQKGDQAAIAENLNLAIAAGKKAVEIAPKKAENIESLAFIYENSAAYIPGSLELAEQSYNKVIELEPSNPASYLRLGLISLARAQKETDQEGKKQDIEAALKKFDEAIAKKANLPAAYYGRSVAEEALGNIDEAIKSLTAAVSIAQDDLNYRFELGRLFLNRGITSGAKLTQEAPSDIVDSAEGNEEESGDSSEELSVAPTNNNSETLARNEDINTAEQLFLSILLVNQNNANARYSLALLYQKLAEKDKESIMVKSLLNLLQDEQQKEAVKQQFPGAY